MIGQLSNTFFFTATINSWINIFTNDKRKMVIINSLKFCCEQKRIVLHAFVIMPNHIHFILTLNDKETQMTFQRDFLKYTAQKLITLIRYEKNHQELDSFISSQNDRILHIWERRPKWIKVDNTLILEQKIDYVHNNPLQSKWDLVENPEDYVWSSASYYLKEDITYDFITHFADI